MISINAKNKVCYGVNASWHTIFMGMAVALFSLTMAGCSSSDSDDEETPQKPEQQTDEPVVENIDWQAVATKSTGSFVDYYWDNSKHFFCYYANRKDTQNKDWSYWPQAHAMDVVIDAYLRTGDDAWAQYFDLWYEGIKQKSGGGYTNDFVDDMEWICLTMQRIYEITKDQKYLDTAQMLWQTISSNWNTNGGGGLAWKQSEPNSKNACSNGPGGIVACRMYRLNGQKDADLQMAKKIYEWESEHLVNIQTGAVYDNLDAGSGKVTDWVFTYNEGTYMGLAHELYKITGQDFYLDMAVLVAKYTIKNLTTDGILKDEGKADAGLFKGIFVRYFTLLIQEKALKESDREEFTEFLHQNALALYNKGTSTDNFYSTNWTLEGGISSTDLPTQTSGCMLMEAWASLQK